MSELSATNCGCGCDNNTANLGGCGISSCALILILLFCCGGFGCGNDRGGCGNNDSCLWIILLLIFCGGCGTNTLGGNGCGCC